VNTSATRPAALVVDDDLVVHLSTELGDGVWVVELRHRAGHGSTPWLDARPAGPVALPGGAQLRLLAPYRPARHPDPAAAAPRPGPGAPRAVAPAGGRDGVPTDADTHPTPEATTATGAASPAAPAGRVRLWVAALRLPSTSRPEGSSIDEYLAAHGRPIRYGADAGDWPLDAYQTVFATTAGSAEMPSAARGFTAELVTRLVSRGVAIAPILLHTGVASQEAGETPYPERYEVSDATAATVNAAVAGGHRVVAVGTTATRAIETVAGPDGFVRSGRGWTDLVITPERGVRVVNGLLTGWHDPEASHLLLVEAIAGRELLDRSYAAAIDRDFRGHEFGDFHLILP
jgi:S-adenosylmethionine:tRNA ribosyltransferase-isomerase